MKQNLMIKGTCEEQEKSSTFGDVRVGDATQTTTITCEQLELQHTVLSQGLQEIKNNKLRTFPVRDISVDLNLPSCVRKDLEAMYAGMPAIASTNDDPLVRLQKKTWRRIRSTDEFVVSCGNMFSGLPDYKPTTAQLSVDIGYTPNMPTLVEYHRKRSVRNQFKYMTLKNKKNVLSKWQERLLEAQSHEKVENVKRLSIVIDAMSKGQKKNRRAKYRKVYLEGSWRCPFSTSSDEEIVESIGQIRDGVTKVSNKLPLPILRNIYEYIDGRPVADEFLQDIMDARIQQCRTRNRKRAERRRKVFIKRRAELLNNWVQMRHEHIVSGRYNYHNAFLFRYCPNKELHYVIPSYYFDAMTGAMNEQLGFTVQSRETYSIPVRAFLESLSWLRDPEHYDYSKVIGICEDLITTMVLMNHSRSWQIALLNFKQWIRMTFGYTVCGSIYTWLENLFSDEIEVQASTFDRVKQVFSTWQTIYQGEFMFKVKKAIACIVALGFCTLNNLPFCTDKFSYEYKKGNYASRSFPDLITCILETVILVFEKAQNWFSGRATFLDIFRNSSSSYSYDVEMAFLRANVSLYEEDKLIMLNIEKYQFEERVQEAIRITKAFYDQSSGSERRIMQINLNDLARIQTKMLLATQAMTIREAPFTYYLYGKSSIGKTAVADILNNALLRANGLDPDPKFQVSLNPADKYQSELESWKILIKLDDLSNTKAEYEENNAGQMLVDYANNNPRHALKADVDSKGKVLIQPKILMATTNVKHVEAHVKSNEPLSILRRLNKCITMVVKPEFCKPGSHMLDPCRMVDDINDAWLFDVEEPVAIATPYTTLGATPFKFEFVVFRGVTLKQIGMKLLIEYLITISRQHFIEQKSLVDSVQRVQATGLCPHDTYEVFCDQCKSGLEVQSNFSDNASEIAMNQLKKVHKLWYMIMEFIPYHILEGDGMWYYLRTVMGSALVWFILTYYYLIFLVMIVLYLLFGSFFTAFCFQTFFTYAVSTLILKCWANIDKIHRNCKVVSRETIKTLEPIIKHKYYVLAGLGSVATVLMIARKMKASKCAIIALTTQGSSYVTPAPDKVQRENVWLKPNIVPPPRTIEVSTTTLDQMTNIIDRVIANATFRQDNSGYTIDCCALPVKGNVWIVPFHVVVKQFDSVMLIRSTGDINDNRNCRINAHSWKRMGTTDLALISLPSAGDVLDLTPYFPETLSFYCEPIRWIHKDAKANVQHYDCVANQQIVQFKDAQTGNEYHYEGWAYKLNQDTRSGLCMATLVSRGKFPWILGFHSAGASGTPHARGHFLHRALIEQTYDDLFDRKIGDECNINVQCHSSGDMILDFPEYGIEHTGNIHYKSPFNFMEKPGCAILYGSHTAPRRTFRSAVENSVIAESVCKHFGVQMMYGKPKNIGNYKPWHADASKLLQPIDMNLDVLGHAFADFERHIFAFLNKNVEYKEILSPMSRVATLSGVDGCRGIDAIKLSTSAGFPRCKPKSNYVFVSEEEHENITRPLDVSPEVWLEIDRLESILATGKRVYFIHRINLKDEPTKLEKEKVRTFAGCTLECLILIRMYFLPIAKMMMDNPDIFECAIGINAHGPEWTELTLRMQKHGEDRTIAGDYKDYDTLMWCYLVLLAFCLFIEIAEWAGYDKRQITIMRGIATELAYGLTDYNGEYAMFLIQNLSGHGLTVFINNLVNSLYQRYAYYDIWAALVTDDKLWIQGLKKHLNMDDAQFATFTEVYLSNIPSGYPKPFAENVSLVCYGDDNKMSVSKDINYFNHCTISYSLGKCGIGYTMADKTSESVPFINASDCGFLKRHSVWSEEFKQYLAPLELNSMFKTLQASIVSKVLSREQQAVESIDSVLRELFYHGETVFNEWRDKLNMVIDECNLRSYFPDHSLHTYEFLKSEYVRKYLCDSDIKNNHASNSIDEIAKPELIVLDTQSRESTNYHSFDKALLFEGNGSYLGTSSPAQGMWRYDDDNHSHYIVKQRIANTTTTNKDKVNTISSMMGPEQHQTVVFRDGTPQWTSNIEGAYDDTRKVGMDMSVPLDQFFSRPIKYSLPDWIPGSVTPYEHQFDPWSLFYNNKRVNNRISNYNLLQSTLKVKILINGNPFYYGRLMLDYAPLADYRSLDDFRTSFRANIVSASQRTHIYLNPTTSQAGEIMCPFIHPKNALIIPFGEWSSMGRMYVRELNALKHANASNDPISVVAYIWAENVALSVPTSDNAGNITAQASVSMNSVNSNKLGSNISKIAVINKPTSHLALVDDYGDDPAKLTLTRTQGLMASSDVVGAKTGDELDIVNIASKESYLTTFTWSTSAISDTLLWNTRVGPNVAVRHLGYSVNAAYQLPACAFAALPFQYWRGTMRYRFQIAASEFHRGRLRIVYDPQFIEGTGQEVNLGFTKIVDLSNENDFTIDVSWGQDLTYLQVGPLGGWQSQYGIGNFNVANSQYNGVLAVYIVNDLTSPNNTVNNDVGINVFVSMTDDAQFQSPDESIKDLSFTPQSNESCDTAVDVTDNAPLQSDSDDNIMMMLPKDNTNSVYFGEIITNFNQLMRRYNYYRSQLSPANGSYQWLMTKPDFPLYRGRFNATGIDIVLPAGDKANLVTMTLVNYISAAFLARRGGMRWKHAYVSDKAIGTNFASVIRNPTVPSLTYSSTQSTYAAANSQSFANKRQVNAKSLNTGGELTYMKSQPILEFQVPDYRNVRFSIPKNGNLIGGPAYFPYANGHTVEYSNDNTALSFVDMYVAAGDDFNLHIFQGAPPIAEVSFSPG